MVSVHCSLGFALHIGQRTESMWRAESFPVSSSIFFFMMICKRLDQDHDRRGEFCRIIQDL